MTTHREGAPAQCSSAQFLRDDSIATNVDVDASSVGHTARPSAHMALLRQRHSLSAADSAEDAPPPPVTRSIRKCQTYGRFSPRSKRTRSIPLKLVLMLACALLFIVEPPSCFCIVRFFSADDLRYTFGVEQISDVPANYKHFYPRLIFLNDDEISRAKAFRYAYARAENDTFTTSGVDAVGEPTPPRRLHGIQINFDEPGRSDDGEAAGTMRLELEPVTRQLYADQLTVVRRNEAHGAGELEINRLNEAWRQASADGEDRSLWTDDCHYHHKSNDTYAAISNCDGSLKGIIVRADGIYIIHPIPERHAARLKRSADNLPLHVLYKRDALIEQKDFCGIENTITSEELQEDEAGVVEDVFVVGQRLVQESDLVVELAIFVDELLWRQFSAKYGSAAWQRLQQYAVTMLSNIQIMYKQPSAVPQLTFKIVRYEVFMTQPSALAPQFHDNGHAQRYLDRFCRYQRSLGVRDWDHALLLTGYDIHRGSGSRSISGIARLDGMCDPWNTCTLAEGLDFTSAFIGTHELGHSVGMRHDEPYCQSRFIMSASLGPGKVTWSTCSLRDYHTFLQRMDARRKNCLRTSLLREKIPLTDALKPGQIYNANLQCSLMHGNGYVQVSPRQDHYDSICYMMWCGQGAYGRIITSHPALEGTFCGPSKWCQLGRCVPWTGYGAALTLPQTVPPPPPRLPVTVTTQRPIFAPTAPTKLNGGWSAWSAFGCQHCYCSTIVGSIGVALSTRSCNNPAPFNGGQECTGSAQRAAVCAHKCPAESVSVDQYISSKCAEHKRTNKDEELTGSGSQLNRFPQRACKIFCDVNTKSAERNYRFYGDNLPDGTPCGWDRYCVSGECVDLSCESSALMAHDVPCPQPSERCPINTAAATPTLSASSVAASAPLEKGQWGAWSAWSTCTVSCGPSGGFQVRSRVCSISNRCEGEPTERQACNAHACPPPPVVTEPQWTEWTSWNQCSVSCGRGSQARYRRCQTPQAVIAFSCPGQTMDIRNCEELPCSAFTTAPSLTGEWASWGTWSACSTTCGPGSQSRSRTCKKEPCDGAGQQRLACNLRECAQWNEWGVWSECSRLCDKGIRSRTRSCPNGGNCAGSSTEQGFCNEQPCTGATDAVGQWTGWSEWGACSLTCGAGVKRRSRHCVGGNCPGNPRESAICVEATCKGVNDASWGGWGFWSTCSETCGNGVRRRVRKCYGSGNCFGNEFEREPCNERSCETDQKLQQIFH